MTRRDQHVRDRGVGSKNVSKLAIRKYVDVVVMVEISAVVVYTVEETVRVVV